MYHMSYVTCLSYFCLPTSQIIGTFKVVKNEHQSKFTLIRKGIYVQTNLYSAMSQKLKHIP